MTYLQTIISYLNPDFKIIDGKKNYTIISPVPHEQGIEKNPSSTYFLDSNTIFDFYHQKTYKEIDIAVLYENIDNNSAYLFLKLFKGENWIDYEPKMELETIGIHNIYRYFDRKVLDDLGVSIDHQGNLILPVVYYGRIIDLRKYQPNSKVAKVYSATAQKTTTGLIVPYDEARNKPTNKVVIVCEGEKDMLMARSMGLNAICITGGALRIPEFNNSFFKDRRFFICYDNDETGRRGADRLGNYLLEKKANKVKILDWTKITKFKPQPKNDLFDFFTLYNQTKNDLIDLYKNVPNFKRTKTKIQIQDELINKSNLKSINEAKQIQNSLGKIIRSRVQIVANWEETLVVPSEFGIDETETVYKIKQENIEDNLLLLGNKTQQEKVMRDLLEASPREKIKTYGKFNAIYRYDIYDFEAGNPQSATLYSINQSLITGNKYNITYKVVSHPLEKNQVVFILINAQNIDNEIDEFYLNKDDKKVLLDAFSVKENESLDVKMLNYFEEAKNYIGSYINKDVYYITELLFHSVLQIIYNAETIRGCLDILMIGATRIGKSETARKLIQLYNRGTILSLKNSTENGLIGGSTRTTGKGGWKLTIGELTRQHKGLIIMEELQGCSFDPHRALTDLRSSGELRLVRVSGTMRVPTINRRLTLSNPKNPHLDIRQYTNGIKIVKDLVEKVEDIARYDLICIPDAKDEMIRPSVKQKTPRHDQSLYIKKIQWAWSRKAKDVKINNDTKEILWKETIRLNKLFENNTQLIGRETDLKLIRFATAVAVMVVSTDDDFEKVIVKKEHIEWASKFIEKIYSNPLFKLDEYVKQQNKHLITTDDDFVYIQKITQENRENLKLIKVFANYDGAFITRSYIQTMWDNKDAINTLISDFINRYYLQNYKPNEFIITKRFRKVLNKYRD